MSGIEILKFYSYFQGFFEKMAVIFRYKYGDSDLFSYIIQQNHLKPNFYQHLGYFKAKM